MNERISSRDYAERALQDARSLASQIEGLPALEIQKLHHAACAFARSTHQATEFLREVNGMEEFAMKSGDAFYRWRLIELGQKVPKKMKLVTNVVLDAFYLDPALASVA